MASAPVDLSLPRWSFGSDLDDLSGVLKSMGLLAPFSPGGFANLTADPTFRLDDVIQHARIDVGEKGTVAAAATMVEGIASGAVSGLQTVTADHPFAYAIVDNLTGVPLFEGTVGDPSQH